MPVKIILKKEDCSKYRGIAVFVDVTIILMGLCMCNICTHEAVVKQLRLVP